MTGAIDTFTTEAEAKQGLMVSVLASFKLSPPA
jgi:hypothetical protein